MSILNFLPARVVVGVLIFLGSFTSYMLKINISIIIIDLYVPFDNHSNRNDTRYKSDLDRFHNMFNIDFGEMKDYWRPLNPLTLACIMSSYNLGYSFSLFVSKRFADKFGIRKIVGITMVLAALLTAINPLVYYVTTFAFIAVRFLIGFMSGFWFPLFFVLIVNWSPLEERNTFSLCLHGTSVGMIVCYPLSAYIMSSLSWHWIAYIFGLWTFFFSILWYLYVTDWPEQHKCINEEEQEHINFRQVFPTQHRVRLPRIRKGIPWREIIQATPVRAVFFLLLTNTWNLSFFMDFLPMYFYFVLDCDLLLSSFLLSTAIIVRICFSVIGVSVSKVIISKGLFSVGGTRKLFTIFSQVVPGLIQLSMIFHRDDKLINVIKILSVLGLNGVIVGGAFANIGDLSPHYAGSLYSTIQASLCFAGVTVPFLVGLVLLLIRNTFAWVVLFLINAILLVLGGVIFIIFGTGSVQEWDFVTLRRNLFREFLKENDSEDEV